MDLSAAGRDIHELVEAFAQAEEMSLRQLKELWKIRGFSFIHEACPKDTTQAFFMQSLYSSALGHVKCVERTLSWKLGGLFVLYCLYETQYVEPFYLIYLSLEDLERLHGLVKELRRIEHAEALKVLRTMLRKEAFLFGCVSVDQKSIADACEKLANQAAARLKHARFKLLANVPLQEHIYRSLTEDLSLDSVMSLVRDYAEAKQQVFTGLGVLGDDRTGAVPNFAEELRETADDWEIQKKDLLSINGLEIPPLRMQPSQPKRKRQNASEIVQKEEVGAPTEEDLLADEILGLIDME
ncbi:uncharacterized protein [Physcomitrium patens]|uniref:Uncharacterized protein n=1 Tax=Physcomitrium patens TaxID=3218 RepID=A0A2K1J6Z8_PHYPA|nr:uncharacterized protein LOC112293523 [Physcomitrium patens]PNR37300.1 hypothetical protein PHYPA_020408 [Physcomitrium patens]|eukprot:XP_024398800.1 uncharacterized protein LOC112293523 [Physcomitrella patens]